MIDETRYDLDKLTDITNGSELERVMKKFSSRMQLYSGGIKEIRTKLEILDEEFKSKFSYNPIHNIESRLKSIPSIVQKIKAKGLEVSIDSITENITDIAGIRVICNYIDDIYRVAEMLTAQDDITVLQMRDYIKNPKASGYKSLHLIVEVPVFLSTGPVPMPVEIQIRTIAMDFWASLEHKLKYKTNNAVDDDLHERLKKCADEISVLDTEMQDIHNTINSRNKAE
ncbi:MAG: GTP pyrophosphokinase family protein [Oscillospiraceae bacterium]|nr:GTP pyrophosphokinase family protein [Oscillospiraceae bacterium]